MLRVEKQIFLMTFLQQTGNSLYIPVYSNNHEYWGWH